MLGKSQTLGIMYKRCTYGEMDITTVFGTVIGGSSPSRCTSRWLCDNVEEHLRI